MAPNGNWVDRWIGDSPCRTTDQYMRHGVLYMVLIFTAEYVSGTWLKARGMCPWDYTGRQSSINGLIRLDFAPLWFATGLFFERLTRQKKNV